MKIRIIIGKLLFLLSLINLCTSIEECWYYRMYNLKRGWKNTLPENFSGKFAEFYSDPLGSDPIIEFEFSFDNSSSSEKIIVRKQCEEIFHKHTVCAIFDKSKYYSENFMIETSRVMSPDVETDLEFSIYLKKPVAKKYLDVKFAKGDYSCAMNRIAVYGSHSKDGGKIVKLVLIILTSLLSAAVILFCVCKCIQVRRNERDRQQISHPTRVLNCLTGSKKKPNIKESNDVREKVEIITPNNFVEEENRTANRAVENKRSSSNEKEIRIDDVSVAIDNRCDVSRSGSGRSFRSSDWSLTPDQRSVVGKDSDVCVQKSHVNEGFVGNEAENANEALNDWKFAVKKEIENIEAIAAAVIKPEVSDSCSGNTSEGSGTKADSSSSADRKCQVLNNSNISDHGGSSGYHDNNVFVKDKNTEVSSKVQKQVSDEQDI